MPRNSEENPDYISDLQASERLARRIQGLWHRDGDTWARAWVEPRKISNTGVRRTDWRYDIRSNVIPSYPRKDNGMRAPNSND